MRPSQQAKYRSQAERKALSPIPASGIPFPSTSTSKPTVRPTTVQRLNCASGDTARIKLCIRRHRPCQTVHPTTAPASNCTSDDSPRIKLCLWRQLESKNRPWLSSRTQFESAPVARGTVWPRGCRQGHSLPGDCHQVYSLCRTITPTMQLPFPQTRWRNA